MKKIDWSQKLTSRKLWGMIIALVTAILVLMNVPMDTIAQVATIIGGFGSVIMYIYGESKIDAARLMSPFMFEVPSAMVDTEEFD